jgi:omega-amidase
MKQLVAVGQPLSQPDPLVNFALAQSWAEIAAARGASLLILPELFDSGYHLGHKGSDFFLDQIAQDKNISIVCGLSSREGGRSRNSSFLFSPTGPAQRYDKLHLFEGGAEPESSFFSAGEKRAEWLWQGVKATPLICYDLRFPELARAGALAGSEIFVVSSAWPESRREVFRVLCQARAIENQAFLLSSNLAGTSAAGHFAGHSMVMGPDGAILAEAGEGEELLFAEIDLAHVKIVRARMPCLKQIKNWST